MKKYKKGGKKFPDLNGDGKVTFADVLKGRGVKKAGKGMKYKNGGKLDGITSVTKGGRRVTEVNTSGEGLERSVTTRKKNMKRGVKLKSKIVKQSAGGNTITKKKMKDGQVTKSKTRSVSDKAAARAAKKIENIVRKSRGLK